MSGSHIQGGLSLEVSLWRLVTRCYSWRSPGSYCWQGPWQGLKWHAGWLYRNLYSRKYGRRIKTSSDLIKLECRAETKMISGWKLSCIYIKTNKQTNKCAHTTVWQKRGLAVHVKGVWDPGQQREVTDQKSPREGQRQDGRLGSPRPSVFHGHVK